MTHPDQLHLGDAVRIWLGADSGGHLYPTRFTAFQRAQMIGHVVELEDADVDPHPVCVDFATNPLNPECMWLSADELEGCE